MSPGYVLQIVQLAFDALGDVTLEAAEISAEESGAAGAGVP